MQKKYKKLAASVAAVFAASAMVMNAAFALAPTAAIDGNVISAAYNHEEAGFGTMVYLLNAKVSDADTIDSAYLSAHLVWAGAVSGGTVSYALPQDAPYGVYTVLFGADGLSDLKSSRAAYVLYEEPGVKARAVSEIKGAATAGEMAAAYQKYNNKAFMIDESILNANADMVFDLVGQLGSDATAEDVAACVATAAEYSAMKTMTEAEIAKTLEENYKTLGLDGDILLYSDKVAARMASGLPNCTTVSQIQKLAKDSLALTALNEAVPSKFFEVLKKYDAVFQVTLSNRLDQLGEHQYELTKQLADKEYTAVDAVGSQVNQIINALYQKYYGDGGSGGSGGGGNRGGISSGGGNSSVSGLTQPTVDQMNDNQSAAAERTLTDLEGYDWASEAILALFEDGVLSGDGDGKFRPGDGILREEFTKLLIMAFCDGKTESKSLKFTDVADAWYKPYIETAFAKGIVNGVSEDTFGVGQYLTREDAAVMLQRAAEATYHDITKKQTLVGFTDQDSIADYARIAVDMLARAQIFNGFEDGSFRPQARITRAEVAKVIYGFVGQ